MVGIAAKLHAPVAHPRAVGFEELGDTMKPIASLLPSTAIGNVAFGAAAAMVGPSLFRPAIVGLVRVGYAVQEVASDAWAQARTEAQTIRAEAATRQSSDSEVQQLRDEVAALKAQLAAKK